MADDNRQQQQGVSEEEPLLGQPGDATLESGQPLYYNLWLGELALEHLPYSPISEETRWRRMRRERFWS